MLPCLLFCVLAHIDLEDMYYMVFYKCVIFSLPSSIELRGFMNVGGKRQREKYIKRSRNSDRTRISRERQDT